MNLCAGVICVTCKRFRASARWPHLLPDQSYSGSRSRWRIHPQVMITRKSSLVSMEVGTHNEQSLCSIKPLWFGDYLFLQLKLAYTDWFRGIYYDDTGVSPGTQGSKCSWVSRGIVPGPIKLPDLCLTLCVCFGLSFPSSISEYLTASLCLCFYHFVGLSLFLLPCTLVTNLTHTHTCTHPSLHGCISKLPGKGL